MTKTLMLTLAVVIALAAPPFNRAQTADGGKTLTPEQEVEAVRASDALFAFGAFKLGEVTVRIEGERATVSGILTKRPDGGDKNSRRRYFYTRTFVSRDGRRQILEARLVSLYANAR